ncbi:MAG: NAD(P)/FAD-dependent oxidoreductase [Gammaproteobacteria bacterium]|nr:NAD(P)/FAD-dependent oxidoreductase [Gammaproteobacteria bacterium]
MSVDDTGYDAVVVGAGFAGLYMLYRLRQAGFRTRVFEAGSGVGGTWYWNRYPGARCDVESMEYSYSFCDELQQEWEWTERYAGQPEILRYVNHVADRFDLRRDITFDTRVVRATFDEDASRWQVETDTGLVVDAAFVIMATGCLSSANLPEFDGRDDFQGETYHTGRWPHEGVDFAGKRVGIIGTGSSAIQAIPIIAAEAGHLTVFQRTPNYSIPARNAPIDPDYVREIKAEYSAFRARNYRMQAGFGSKIPHNDAPASSDDPASRESNYAVRWERGGFGYLSAYNDLLRDRDANETAAEFVRQRIRGIVDDPDIAERLCPDNVIGCKRPCLDTGYFETYNRANVELVDARDAPIERITPNGVVAGGREYVLDCIVFATGFDAMTGAVLGVDFRGRDGMTLADKWHAGPRTYLGLGTVGFPNLFLITGPGSPSVLTNMIVSIEQHAEWISDCLEYLRAEGLDSIEATPEAEDAWVEHVNLVAGLTLYPTCNSWYLGKNIPGKPQVFMPLVGFPPYAEKCATAAANGYEGFDLA